MMNVVAGGRKSSGSATQHADTIWKKFNGPLGMMLVHARRIPE